MKKVLPLFVLITFLACNNQKDEVIEFETIISDKTVQLSNEVNSPSCRVHLKLKQAKSTSGHPGELINEAIIQRFLSPYGEKNVKVAADKFASDYTTSYQKNMLPLYNQDRTDTTKRSWYEYHYIIESTTQKGMSNTIAYLTTIDYYEGGAHSINQLHAMNFDARTGQLLTLGDIFATGYEQPLKEVLLNALKSKTGCKNLEELHDKGYLFSMDMFPSENFILGDGIMTFIYNPYEIASYDLGSTELVISFNQVEKLLKNTFEYQ